MYRTGREGDGHRSEGFPNGIFHPCALWARGLARWESCRHAVVAAAVGVTWKSPRNSTLTVLVFGPESISYERSRRETAAKFHHFSARVFFEKIPQSQYSTIYTILRFFQDTYSQNGFFPMLCSHPTRPPVRPSARHGSQVIRLVCFPVFPGSQVIKIVRVPVFPGSQFIKMTCFPVFPGSQVIKMDRFPMCS